jgi:two-component system, OmpR family, response regulator
MQDTCLKVLVVDDEPNIALAVCYLLDKEGMQTTTASSGEQALELLRSYPYDLIVLDVMMPGLNGYEVAKRMHIEGLCPEARIVFLTAKGAESDRKEGFAAGGEYYITKPFDTEVFVQTIKEIAEYEL